MSRLGRGGLLLVPCAAVLAIALTHVDVARASDDEPDPGWADQASSNGASASATNDSSTSQSSTQTQTGGSGGGGQSQFDGAKRLDRPKRAVELRRDADGGQRGQRRERTSEQTRSSASSNASNASSTGQQSSQSQTAGDGGNPDPAGAGSQAQTTRQDAPTEQKADAQAASTQVAPTNVNIVVRVDSPGNDGPLTQTNSSVADATASNANHVVQAADQAQLAGGAGMGQSQDTSQNAPTTQHRPEARRRPRSTR
jgi:hypothetical protein